MEEDEDEEDDDGYSDDSWLLPDYFKSCLDEFKALRYSEYPSSDKTQERLNKLLEVISPSYKTPNLQVALNLIAEYLLESNSQGVIYLLSDGTLNITAEEYYCGY